MLSNTKNYILVLCLLLLTPLAQAGHDANIKVDTKDLKVGEGIEASPYSVVDVHYTGKLEDGSVFDSSTGRQPFRFTIGAGQVIPGWDMGIQGMMPGGKRVLTIPPELAYGKAGTGDKIPPNATLIFDVELVAATPPPFNNINNEQLQTKLESGIKLIDIRRADEWAQTGIVEGSIKSTAFDGQGRFQESFIDMLKNTVKPDEEFALICRTGNRSAALSNWLVTKGGYSKVLNVQNGIVTWIKEGQSVSR